MGTRCTRSRTSGCGRCCGSTSGWWRERRSAQRPQVLGEHIIEERAWSPLANRLHDFRAGHAQAVQDAAGDEGGAVEAHAAMREHAAAVRHEMRAEVGEG